MCEGSSADPTRGRRDSSLTECSCTRSCASTATPTAGAAERNGPRSGSRSCTYLSSNTVLMDIWWVARAKSGVVDLPPHSCWSIPARPGTERAGRRYAGLLAAVLMLLGGCGCGHRRRRGRRSFADHQRHRSSPAAGSRLVGCRSRLGRRLGVARRRCRDDIVNDALGAALASADDLISGRQVFRNDLQRRVLDTGIGKAFLDRFQDVCAHRRRASCGPSTAAHEKSDRERRRGRAPAPLEPSAIARRRAAFVARAITAVTKVAKRVSIVRSERGQMAIPALPTGRESTAPAVTGRPPDG